MSRWDDCLELLRSGQSSTQALPAVRALLDSLPPAAFPPPENASPTAGLRHEINQTHFQTPYLRPPPNVWESFRKAKDVYDGEMKFDLLGMFKARMVEGAVEGVEEVCEFEELRMEDGGMEEMIVDIEVVAREIERGGINYRALDMRGWAGVLSIAEVEWSVDSVVEVLRKVNQACFSRVMLHSIIPLLDITSEEVVKVVRVAVSLGDLDGMSCSEVQELMGIYEGLGVSGALAQIEMMCRE